MLTCTAGCHICRYWRGNRNITEKLAERSYFVYAVEPNADMRGQLIVTLASYPNVTIIDGTDEATNLPDCSVDVVTVAHALHWFNTNAFRKECLRILKPEGLVIVVYNLAPGGRMVTLSKQSTDAFFQKPIIMEFSNPVEYTREKWIAYITSMEEIPLPADPEYDTHIIEVNAIFDRDSINGLLHQDRVIKIYSERIV